MLRDLITNMRLGTLVPIGFYGYFKNLYFGDVNISKKSHKNETNERFQRVFKIYYSQIRKILFHTSSFSL